MKHVLKTLGFGFFNAKESTNHFFNPLTQLLRYLFNSRDSGVMNSFEKNKLFSNSNKGLLLDGQNHRLSLSDSFTHLALISRTGGGKTTSYVVPNILTLGQEKNSMLITDISGEIYEKTSGYLAKQGYKIYVLNPEDLSESIGYNPLYYATDSSKIDELAQILVKSSKQQASLGGADNSEFWEAGAKSLISILIKLLISIGDHKYINLANLRYLINNYGSDGESLYHLVETFADDKTYHEFRGFIKGNPQTILSMVSTANVALSPIGINDNLEKLTSSHTINFDKFREEKSVLYIKIPEQKQKQYSFLVNIFYHQFFSEMMKTRPTDKDLPIFCLLDEFGNMNLPNFETTITTVRKYKISVSIILQNIKQLENKYGKANAEIILDGGIASKLFFSGADLPTTEMLSKILGTREQIKTNIDGNFYLKEELVMKASDIRTMKDNEALFIMTNKKPVKLETKPYFEDFRFNRYTKEKPYEINSNVTDTHIEYIDLEYSN